MSDTLVYT